MAAILPIRVCATATRITYTIIIINCHFYYAYCTKNARALQLSMVKKHMENEMKKNNDEVSLKSQNTEKCYHTFGANAQSTSHLGVYTGWPKKVATTK